MNSYTCTRDSLGGARIEAIDGRMWVCVAADRKLTQ